MQGFAIFAFSIMQDYSDFLDFLYSMAVRQADRMAEKMNRS